jgi:cell division septum initiation protein DivIVA
MAGQQFRVVLRGYEPAQVDQRLTELAEEVDEARRYAEQLAEQVRVLESQPRSEASQEVPAPASLMLVGQRVAEIFRLAEEAACELLELGRTDLDDERREASVELSRRRSEVARDAEQRRITAEAEAAQVLDDARRAAEQRLDAAESDAAVRRHEAAAMYERQRAALAQAAADLEATIARRRSDAEGGYTNQMREHERLLAELKAGLEEARTRAHVIRGEVKRESRRVIEDAEEQARAIVGDARAFADRRRADLVRELAEATQRRDGINAQLTNVRHKLALLTGSGAATVAEM